jgi:hypothetical protein
VQVAPADAASPSDSGKVMEAPAADVPATAPAVDAVPEPPADSET